MSITRIISLVAAGVLLLFILIGMGSLFETLDATEIMVVQGAIDGKLHWYTTPGVKSQWFGRVTKYHKRAQYWFSKDKDHEGVPIHIRFNDGANADIHGSIAWEMPMDEPTLTKLHSRYGSQMAVDNDLIRTIVDKAIYLTGPTMSSKESYSDRRADLISLVQDQINHGVYQTKSTQVREKDALSGQEKTVTVASIVLDENGMPKRQEKSPLEEFGIRAFNLSINSVAYDGKVEEQIGKQQQAVMDVQTAMATAKKAEQNVITAEKEGEANAAKAKWDQEVIKAKEVTAAEQRLEVARLDTQAAEQEKQRQILLGTGEAERRKLVMSADGALEIKVNAWLESQKIWAGALQNYKGALVPSVVMGQGQANGANTMQTLMETLGVKAARDLAIDMGMAGAQKTK